MNEDDLFSEILKMLGDEPDLLNSDLTDHHEFIDTIVDVCIEKCKKVGSPELTDVFKDQFPEKFI